MKFDKIYIGGQWVKPSHDQLLDVINPATEEVHIQVPRCTPEDAEAALEAAYQAKDSWKSTPLEKRLELLGKALEYFKERAEELALSIVREMGSPLRFAKRAHVEGPITDFRDFLTLAETIEFVQEYPGYRLYREPLGVVSCMTPWNYPLNQIIQKVIPALVTGNTVVLKPSSQAPSAAFYLAEAFDRAELPPGVFNMITGKGNELGETLSKDWRIAMVSFTGSTAVGKEILEHGAESIKKTALELGGKSPALLLESGDVDLAVKRVLNSCFYNTGQTCSAFTRFFVPSHREEEVLKKIEERISFYKVGNPEEEDTIIGPLVSKERQKKVRAYVEKGIEEGATLAFGELPDLEKTGCYYEPSVFTGVNNNMKIAREEIFGPVLCIIPYDDLDEAIKECNDTSYGLSGSVFGEKEEAIKAAERLETGNVHINEHSFVFNAPFGGYKESGIGRESGTFGLLEFTEIKAVFI